MALGAQDAITVMYNSTIHGLEVISEHANRHFIASQDMRTQELAQVKHLHEMLEDADRKLEKLAPQLEAFANSIMIQQTHVQQSVELARVQTAKHAQEVQEALSFLNASLSCVVLPSWSSWESSGTMVLDLLSRSPALINRNSYILLPGVQLFIWITSHVLRALWMGLYGFVSRSPSNIVQYC
ncbi:hypothetical protein CC85DRAFT_284436 [Cutaneotrichosporon oleaginosum]|uniref:Uncharacterized protein n=1 Tax=Cutaneotrichosporon oleaginosum TaxID=879819 RepID=A0A0J0XQY9_9TREE|nr:uncharacterized protein CC85DRAFT_284436 [Cutaneotrichosporon oleaginosum]KLT43513.1 hypothetical protein CC85DRAFT_284436 [Cutaneotrichosporon oleaginosum]TXT05588.1 hypothetical protein COLE_06908 [Cutaneotrichosporon oleaginosum]